MSENSRNSARRGVWGGKTVATAIGLTLVAVVAIPVLANPGNGGFHPTNITTATLDRVNENAVLPGTWGLRLGSNGSSTVGVDDVTVDAGGTSGWHTHAGLVIISVKTGTLRWTDGETCQTTIYSAGDSFVEPANHLHHVSSPGGARFTGVQLRPQGSPGRLDTVPPPPNNCGL